MRFPGPDVGLLRRAMISIAGVLLAAGRGERFGPTDHSSKLVASLAGRPIIYHSASALVASGVTPVVAVLGHAAGALEVALTGLPIRLVYNPTYRMGLASSIAIGVSTLPKDVQGAVIALADMPLVSPLTIRRLIKRFEDGPTNVDAVVPRSNGRSGNPVLFGRRIFEDLLRLDGDRGARNLLSGLGDRVALCDVEDEGILIDIDTREDILGLDRPNL